MLHFEISNKMAPLKLQVIWCGSKQSERWISRDIETNNKFFEVTNLYRAFWWTRSRNSARLSRISHNAVCEPQWYGELACKLQVPISLFVLVQFCWYTAQFIYFLLVWPSWRTLKKYCRHGRRKGGGQGPPGSSKFQQKKVVFLVSSGKNQISPLFPP